jgi:hypothetical protein
MPGSNFIDAGVGCFLLALHHAFDELGDWALAFCDLGDFGSWGEEEAGAAGIDVVGGDALEDLADGGLDGGPVFWQGEVEGGAAAAALLRVGDWFSGGVVVVAELFLA